MADFSQVRLVPRHQELPDLPVATQLTDSGALVSIHQAQAVPVPPRDHGKESPCHLPSMMEQDSCPQGSGPREQGSSSA